MCVNLVVQGAKPLFLNYIAVGKLNKKPENFKRYFKGCKLSDCKLIGGETAEMQEHIQKINLI